MLTDFSKHGTIILSYYRSGGTQLKEIIRQFAAAVADREEDGGELDVDLDQIHFTEDIDKYFSGKCLGNYTVLLLNNPFVINHLYSTGKLKYLAEDFHMVYLERKDKESCLLSLPLWEEFIADGLYSDTSKWTAENMKKFHNRLIKKPIPYYDIYLGHHIPLDQSTQSARYLNLMLHFFTANFYMLRAIAEDFSLHTLYYEDYENTPFNLYEKYFNPVVEERKLTTPRIKEFKQRLKDSKRKIPYIADNYIDYYDQATKDAFKQWDLNAI